MKASAYNQVVLTVIAISLSALAIEHSTPRTLASPPAEDHRFENIQYQYGGTTITFFDKSTGDLWNYGAFGSDQAPVRQKLVKLGEPLEK